LQKLIIILVVFIKVSVGSDEPYVIMVSFDGFRHDYMNKTETPNFDKLEKEGVKAESLIPVFPSLTFPNHYSIATGSYAGTHNITGNSFYDKKFKEEYNLYNRSKVKDPKFYKSEPIWVTAERQGVLSASFYWVGTEAPIKGHSPSLFKYYDGTVPFVARVDSVINWLQLPEEIRPKLVLLYFSEPDHTGHIMGTNTNDIIKSVSDMDALLGYLLKELENLPIYPNLNIIVLSDHGMVDVSSDRIIILDDYISKMNAIYVRGNGAHVQFDIKEEYTTYKDLFVEELSAIPNCKFWKKNNIPRRFQFQNNNTNDYLLLADEGWLITTLSDHDKKPFTIKGMHGYDPSLSSMHGIFYAKGVDIKDSLIIPSFENIHIYPFICKLLDINPYQGMDDSPQGKIEVLEKILR